MKPRFLDRLSREIGGRGAPDGLWGGIKDSGYTFRLVYFRPARGLNEGTQRLHAVRYKLALGPLPRREGGGRRSAAEFLAEHESLQLGGSAT